jgi:hypothetical protein
MQQIMYCVLPDNFWPSGHFQKLFIKVYTNFTSFFVGNVRMLDYIAWNLMFFMWYMITIKNKNSMMSSNYGSFRTCTEIAESLLKGQEHADSS